MSPAITTEIMRLGGNPADAVWLWLVTRGPHGPSFTWSQIRGQPPGYVAVEHLHDVMRDLASSIPGFDQRARQVVRLAMQSELPELTRRAIQVAAIVGGSDELLQVKRLADSPDPAVASDAKACAFYLKGRV